jgi:hypothetical protein
MQLSFAFIHCSLRSLTLNGIECGHATVTRHALSNDIDYRFVRQVCRLLDLYKIGERKRIRYPNLN